MRYGEGYLDKPIDMVAWIISTLLFYAIVLVAVWTLWKK
jgi:hypothetical protein